MKTNIGHVEIAPASNGFILYAHPVEGKQENSDIYVVEVNWEFPRLEGAKLGQMVLRAFGLEVD